MRTITFDKRMVKFTSLANSFTALAYVPENGSYSLNDKIMAECRKIDKTINTFQFIGDSDNGTLFNNLVFVPFNIYGYVSGEPILISFDFENSAITIGGKKFAVISNSEYTLKIKGNKVFALNGIEGFYTATLEFMESKSVFNSWFYGVINRNKLQANPNPTRNSIKL